MASDESNLDKILCYRRIHQRTTDCIDRIALRFLFYRIRIHAVAKVLSDARHPTQSFGTLDCVRNMPPLLPTQYQTKRVSHQSETSAAIISVRTSTQSFHKILKPNIVCGRFIIRSDLIEILSLLIKNLPIGYKINKLCSN